MITRYLWLCCWLLCAGALQAQPGGGGGIGFQQLYGRTGGRLVPLSWQAAGARVFEVAEPINDHYSLITQEDYSPHFERLKQAVRLLLIYQADTMVLDLDHLWKPNGAGYRHQLDSLVILPGYFHYADTVGIPSFTPHTVATLLVRHQLTYRPHAWLGFLAPNRLGAAYYLALSQQRLLQQQPDSALVALRAAEARQPRLQAGPLTATRRATAYRQLGNYPVAIQWATRAIALERAGGWLAEPHAYGIYQEVLDSYAQRQHLYLLQRDDRAALADYDTVAALMARQRAPYPPDSLAPVDRAFFLADSLHQPTAYREAVRRLRQLLPAKSAPAWLCTRRLRFEQAFYVTRTASLYFRLGLAEYRAHQYAAAFQHWRLALVEGQAFHEGGAPYVAHFDSLLARWPNQPSLLLGRAVAQIHYSQIRVPDGLQILPGNYAAALRDLSRAEQLGEASVEVNYYRVLALKQLERWGEMLQQVDVAISKAPRIGELYALRHQARDALKRVEYSDPNDPDEIRYRQLCPAER